MDSYELQEREGVHHEDGPLMPLNFSSRSKLDDSVHGRSKDILNCPITAIFSNYDQGEEMSRDRHISYLESIKSETMPHAASSRKELATNPISSL